jgi:DNA-directed RNA polymerase specialized sigma subunit
MTEEPTADLEDPIESSYQNYLMEPSQENLNGVINSLRPVIDYNVNQLGENKSNILRAEAKVIAAKAIKDYQPESGVKLKTWVSNNMQGLRRAKRKLNTITRIPERIQLEGFNLKKAEEEFILDNDREPTVQELADATGFSIKRITKIRQTLRPVSTESAIVEAGQSQETLPDFAQEALDYVYEDEDTLGKQIIEYKLGYGGKEILPPQEIARKLGISPPTLSRKSLKIALKAQEIEQALAEI